MGWIKVRCWRCIRCGRRFMRRKGSTGKIVTCSVCKKQEKITVPS